MEYKHTIENQNETEKGQSLVELAIFLTILLWLVSGIFDVGRAFFMQFALQDAAEEGIIYGIAYPNECDLIKTRVWNSLEENSSISSDRLGNPVNVTIEDAVCVPTLDLNYGDKMVIEVSAPFTLTMPFLAGNTITLPGTANGNILRPVPKPE